MYKVLLVEDEDMIRKGLAYTFNWSKHDCILIGEAKNGKEGLEMIRTLHPDIVITDINMPLMNGLDMLTEARKMYQFSAIILSVYEEFHLAQKAINIGVTDYLLKPLDHETLAASIERSKSSLKETVNVSEAAALIEQLNILNPVQSQASDFIKEVITFIEENYNKKIGIQDIADAMDVSYATLSNRFKEETHLTLNDYINRYRIQKSIELMSMGNDTISTIASEVGFQDYKYFISVFKKYVKQTPSAFLHFLKNRS